MRGRWQEQELLLDVRGQEEEVEDLGDAGAGDASEGRELTLAGDDALLEEALEM